jgi:isopentenyl-diphosphate Delta-isomerase
MTTHLKRPNSHELAQRKQDHIELTHRSRTGVDLLDARFDYEPLFFSHPLAGESWPSTFLSHNLDFPFWISSMTGGGETSKIINHNLARLCGAYKLGMGLGSCRAVLEDKNTTDFQVRKHMGEQPLFANLGIAQVEELIAHKQEFRIHEMVKTLEASGLIIHVNPLQEWIQPGGDRYKYSPIMTLTKFLDSSSYPVLVKEVGQGMGPRSLKALLELPLAGIEFAAFGGTNFSLLESQRGNEAAAQAPFVKVGHSAHEMVEVLNALPTRGKEFIISGGISNVLDGYYLKSKLKAPSLIGMASAFLEPARESYEALESYFLQLSEALLVAKGTLRVRESE